VKAELGWNSDLKSTDIAISVKNGVVTLAGFVPRYIDKYEAEKAAKRVAGVLAVANDIEIRLPTIDERPDPEIAREVAAALKNQLPFSYEQIKAVVRNGWVTLEGDVGWQYQRQTAERAARPVKGVKGIINDIKIKPRVEPSDIKQKIQEAFRRSADVDANQITVETSGGEVILKGKVRSWIERDEAERVAWRAPGVTKVDDRIVVSPL
jgi:osmotically-inducible protein OsmY